MRDRECVSALAPDVRSLRQHLALRVDKVLDAIVVVRKVGDEICALGQAETGATRKQIDNLWCAGRSADNPIHSMGRGSRSLDRRDGCGANDVGR
jgi:hypothetical protein